MGKEIQINSKILGSENNPVLLMLHGWGHSLVNLYPMGNLLKERFCVHVVDLPGFGNSPLPKESLYQETAWDTFRYAEEIISYMDANKIMTATVLGHSFGGRICLQLASKFPTRIDNLILIDSAGLKPIRSFLSNIRMRKIRLIGGSIYILKKFISKNKFQSLYNWYSKKFGSADFKNAGDLKQVLVKTVTENLEENAKTIMKNTLILWGENDTSTPLYMAKLLHRYIVNSTLIVMKNKGHEPFAGLGSHLCVYHINNYLNKMKND